MIDLGKAKILKGLVAKRGSETFVGPSRIDVPLAHIIEEPAQLSWRNHDIFPVSLTLESINPYYDGLDSGRKARL